MKIKFTLFTAVTWLFLFVQSLNAQSIGDYQSASSGDWTNSPATRWVVWDGDSWEPAATSPVAGDGVITILSTHNITIGLAPVTADQLVVAIGGTLTLNNTLTVNGTGTNLTVAGTIMVNSTLQTGTGTPQAQIDGTCEWIGGTISLPTNVTATGILNINTSNKTLTTTLANAGTINWSASQVAFNNGTLTNSGTFNSTAAASFNSAGGTNLFSNTGTFSKTANAGSVTFNIPVSNSANFTIATGSVISTSATGSFTNSGSLNFTGGVGISLGGTAANNQFNTGTSFTGTGALTISSNTDVNFALSLPSTISLVLNALSNTVGGSGSLAVNGTWTWNSGTLSLPTTINSSSVMTMGVTSTKSLASTLTNNGTINWVGFNLSFNGGTLNNNNAIVASTDNTFTQGSGTNVFNNNIGATFTKSTGTGNTNFNIPVTNAGTIAVSTGTVVSTGASASFSNSGTVSFSSTAFTIAGAAATNTLNAGTVFSGTGTLTVNSNTEINLTLSLPATVTLTYSALVQNLSTSASGTLAINGIMNWGSGTISIPTTINAGATLNIVTGGKTLAAALVNNGTTDWSLADVNFNNSTFTNNGIFTVSGTGNFTITNLTTNNFINAGTFNKNSATVTNITSVNFNNTGTVNVAAGTLAKTGVANVAFNNSGTIAIASGAIFAYSAGGASGLLSLDPGTVISGAGTFRMNANTSVNFPLTFSPATIAEIGIGTVPPINGTGSITVQGVLNWAGGTVSVPITIASGGTMNSTAGKTISGTTFTNNGTVNLSDPVTGSVALNNSTFTNNGLINDNYSVAARSFSNGGGANSFGNTGIYNKTNTDFPTSFASGVPVINTSTGVFRGVGTITFIAPISNVGHISPGGNAAGILAVSANAITGSTPTLDVQIIDGSGAGTGHDRLDMPATTNISGTSLVLTEVQTSPVGSYVVMTAPGPNGFVGTFASVLLPLSFSYTIDNASNPSTVTINKLGPTLPLVWGQFTALGKNNKVDLAWSTLQEINTSHFVIQYSNDGRNFKDLATVPAHLNSNTETFYSYTHVSPSFSQPNQYRIRQVDIDARSTYSEVRSVRFSNGNLVKVIATPNPVRNMLQLSVQEEVNINLSGLSGNILRTLKLQPGVHNLELTNLPAGAYLLSVYQNGKKVESQQIIKL